MNDLPKEEAMKYRPDNRILHAACDLDEIHRLEDAIERIDSVLMKCDRGNGREQWPGALRLIAEIVDEVRNSEKR